MKALALFSAFLLLWGCEHEQAEPETLLIDPVILGTQVHQWQERHIKQSVASTTALANQTQRFLSSPDEERRALWQEAWIKAHEDFHQATLLLESETLLDIDVWPIAPGFIDSLPEYPESGIIHDLTLEITTANLQAQHMITDTSEASLGFHVLEYYAFDRDIEDFDETTHLLNDRRRALITIVNDQLLERVMILQSSIQLTDNDSRPQATYQEIVSVLARRANQISSNLNYGHLHGEYSQRQSQVIKKQYAAMHELLNGEVNINQYLAHRNEEQMGVLNSTLMETITLIPDEGVPDEAASSRIQLLAAAISHQFDDFLSL